MTAIAGTAELGLLPLPDVAPPPCHLLASRRARGTGGRRDAWKARPQEAPPPHRQEAGGRSAP